MTPPNDRQIFKGEIATFWFEDGILVSLSNDTLRTVEKIKGNVEFVKNITGNKPVPLLIYLAKSPVPDKQTRKYSTEQLPNIYSAMAMVSKPGLSKFIMNLLFKFRQPPIPIKTFTNPEEGRMWLKQFVE